MRTYIKGMWTTPDSRTINQIDHVMITNRGASSIIDVRKYGADCGSDHFLVGIKYSCKVMTKIQTYKTDRKRLDIPKLTNEETCKEHQDKLEDRLHGRVHSNAGEIEIDQEWEIIKQTIIDSAIETVGYMEKCHRNEWFDEECKQEMNKKNESCNNYLK
jgi:hypothetical protein